MAAKPIVVVFTANSNTGISVIEELLGIHGGAAADVHIRAVVRDLSHKEPDWEGRVEYIKADIKQHRILAPVFKDAKVAYFATPSTPDRAALGKFFVDACFEHGCEHAVIMSYLGSETKATSYHRQFAEIEEYAMGKAGQPVKVAIGDRGHKKFSPTIVRAPPFYQNFYGCLNGIQAGKLYYPLEDKELTHVDFADVGKAIATILVSPEAHDSKAYNIIGETQTGAMLAGTITMKAGHGKVDYENVDDATAVMAFEALGLQKWLAAGNVEMLAFAKKGGFKKYGAGDFKALTGQNPKRFGEFVKEHLKPMLV